MTWQSGATSFWGQPLREALDESRSVLGPDPFRARASTPGTERRIPWGDSKACLTKRSYGYPYMCTLRPGHAGDHIAHGVDVMLARWPQ